jgi:hypothetical protein
MRSFYCILEHPFQRRQIPAKFRRRHPFHFGNLSPSHQQYGQAGLSILEKLV